METSAKEKEYIKLKNSLEALGFHGYLGSDTVPLVRIVLDNLIKATKAFKTIKLENERLENEMRIQGDLVLPLRNENHKLLQDNNELHKEIIDIKDKLEIKSSTTNQNIQKNIENVEQMRFLVSQKNIKIKNLEFQVESLKKKLNDVFEDIYMYNKEENADQRGIQGSRKYLNYGTGYLPELCPLIRQEYSISGTGENPQNIGNNQFNNVNSNEIIQALQNESKQLNSVKEDLAKDLQQNNNEINKLRDNAKALENILKEKDIEIEQYQRRLMLREEEIKRLQNNLFLGDENIEEIKIRYNVDYYREQNEQLKRQNDFLNKENHKLNSFGYYPTHKNKEDEIIKLRGELEKIKFENNKLKQKTLYKNNTQRKKLSTENSKTAINIDKQENERKEILKYQKIIRDLTGDKETLKGKLTQSNKTINEMKNQYQLLQNENDFLKKKIINLEKENNSVKNEKNKNENSNDVQQYINQINELKNKNSLLLSEIETLSGTLKLKESEIIKNMNLHQQETDQINKEIALIKSQHNELKNNKKSLENEVAYLKNQLSLSKKGNNNNNIISGGNYEEIINELKESQNNLKNDNIIKDTLINKLREEKEKLDSDYRILEVKNKNLNDQIINLQKEVLVNTKEENLNEKLKESNTELKNEIEKKNNDINNLEKTNLELKSIITGMQSGNNGLDDNNESQTVKLNETITKLQKDNNKLLKNLELFKQENHLAAEKIKQLESLISGK